jgi:cephalosporin-C deacetylase
MLFDLPLDELRTFTVPPSEPPDFDAFWQETLAEHRTAPIEAQLEALNDPILSLVNAYDLTFAGYNQQPIKGWLLEPADTTTPRPCLVSFAGYNGGRGQPVDHLAPAVAGFVHVVMDTRGQGAGWAQGATPDAAGSGPQYPGFLTRGIESPESYYYRRVFTDAVRCVEAAARHPHVDPQRIAVNGASQGGGIAIATAALAANRVRLLMADVPFLCAYGRATEITDKAPYSEITEYLRCHHDRTEDVFRTLSYFDGVNFAPRVRARTLFSAALRDMVCPPSTIFAAYNRIDAEKDMHVYTYNEHEGGGSVQLQRRLAIAAAHLRAP